MRDKFAVRVEAAAYAFAHFAPAGNFPFAVALFERGTRGFIPRAYPLAGSRIAEAKRIEKRRSKSHGVRTKLS